MDSADTSCYNCHQSLGIYDIKKSEWHDDWEEYMFICPSCEKENVIISNIFKDKHITNNYLTLYKDNKDSLPDKQQQIISEHLDSCQICSDKINEFILNEIEEKLKFNEQSIKYFEKNAKLKTIALESGLFESETVDKQQHIKSFVWENQKYSLTKEDEFCRKEEKLKDNLEIEKVYYYIFVDHWLLGMVSFVFYHDKIILEKIWFKPQQIVELEKKFIDDMKNKKINIKLGILKNISKKLNLV